MTQTRQRRRYKTMDKLPIQIPPELLEKFNDPVDPAEFAANVSKIMSVPADAIPPESEFPKNPKGRPRRGADYGQQAIG